MSNRICQILLSSEKYDTSERPQTVGFNIHWLRHLSYVTSRCAFLTVCSLATAFLLVVSWIQNLGHQLLAVSCFLAVGPWLSAPDCWLLAVGSWLSAPGCGILDLGSWPSATGCWPLTVRSWLWNPGCQLLAANSWLVAPGWRILAVGSWLSTPGCGILAVAFWLWAGGWGILAPGSWLRGSRHQKQRKTAGFP